MRKWLEFQIHNSEEFIVRILNWSNRFEHFILLNSNINKIKKHLYHEYDLIAACGSIDQINLNDNNGFETIKRFQKKHNDWIFGYFGYDMKNETEKLISENFDGLKFPEIFFYVPKYVFIVNNNIFRIEYLPEISDFEEVERMYNEINNYILPKTCETHSEVIIKQRITHDEYIAKVEKIKKNILKGDIYEMNFCQESFAENIDIEPINLYNKLNEISPAPYSVFLKLEDKFLISSSPERFLAKRGNKIISQPIKGTIRRGKNESEDQILKNNLSTNTKERSENVMIVDLVRNDLSKTAKRGSVEVEELCKIYSYRHVHQMISTICSEMDDENYDIVDVIKNAFPMGSMTGAPKIKAMELIENYENTKRGLYSGAVGYINPNGNFDFNVVIRSILINLTQKYLSFTVGSAITHQSDAEKEYEECLLKAEALKNALYMI